jgi:glycosyltransferase involved in cell wall biosynthesis
MASADVLHLHTPWLESNRQFADLAARHGLPYLVSIHGMLDDWSMAQKSLKKRLYLALVGRRFLNRAARVHCTAEAELAQASKWFANSRTAVLPYLVDLAPFETLPGPAAGLALLPPGQRELPKLLFLSRLHEKKGVDVLLRAAAQLRDAGRKFTVMIAGTGDATYERTLKDLVAQLRLQEIVYFLGLITGQTKVSLYKSADVFVLPTQQENFGLVLIESLACGTPVVTTRGTDIWHELEQAGGVIAEPTPEAIARAIARLLDDPAERARRGERGRQWTFQTLAVAPLAERYEALYREVAAMRGIKGR